MAGGCSWSRRVSARARTLRVLLRDTQRALSDVTDIIQFDPDVTLRVQEISNVSTRPTAVVVLGSGAAARARLLHALLGRRLLPDNVPRGCRWLRVQFGVTTQAHLTLGNSEFELVEELECNKQPWETLPLADLIRQDATDLSTMLEVELNNSFLKEGLKIIIPPDIELDPNSDLETLKQVHADLYSKRDSILRNFNPVYLFAIDKIGRNIFKDSILLKEELRSEEDFWRGFNLYSMAGGSNEEEERVEVAGRTWKPNGKRAVLTSENCLDLQQIKEIDPNAQVLFVLFANSKSSPDARPEVSEQVFLGATESSEDYVLRELPESDQELLREGVLRHTQESQEQMRANRESKRLFEKQTVFMTELLDQWEMMCSPPSKLSKSTWIILDDVELMRTADAKANITPERKPPHVCVENCPRGCTLKARTGDHRASSHTSTGHAQNTGESSVGGCITTKARLISAVIQFASQCVHKYMLTACTALSEVHVKLLQQFVLASFDMARELQVIPKKIQYVATQEQQLYEAIYKKFTEGDKKQELVLIMHEVLQELRDEVQNMDWSVDDLPHHQDHRFATSNSIFYSSYRTNSDAVTLLPNSTQSGPKNPAVTPTNPPDLNNPINDQTSPPNSATKSSGSYRTCPTDRSDEPSDGEEAVSYDSYNFDEYEIINSNDESLVSEGYRSRPLNTSLVSQINDIPVENESLYSVSVRWNESNSSRLCSNNGSVSTKQATEDVQQIVLTKLSRKISQKLVRFVDCLKDSYFGTLQRCVESLEWSVAGAGGGHASAAIRQLLAAPSRVSVSLSLLGARSVLATLLQLVANMLRVPGGATRGACCVHSAAWRRRAAARALAPLAPAPLARASAAQILERLSEAHERYQAAVSSLETVLANRLHHTEDVKLAIRKRYAPAFARLCLESTSMCDLLMYGTPELGREIGRGQYGVVYSVRGAWGKHCPVAVKSVLPADERHYQDLAMEFFYTRSIPPHPRIVRLYGSVVQRHGSSGPCVLLVSERKCRDLHAAVRAGLSVATRMRISLDIVDGIRYLHSLGLVHRDIKMKNVLLDSESRAALSDLGFCAAEALISGSVVGTPVHMAPELLAGEYDATVDVYAFGILFWYVCAGNIKLPSAFEAFQNKEQLWSKVKRGLRPERLPHFTDECWEVMESCWASEPSQRAHLGDIHPKLQRILQHAMENQEKHEVYGEVERAYEISDDDSLDMADH